MEVGTCLGVHVAPAGVVVVSHLPEGGLPQKVPARVVDVANVFKGIARVIALPTVDKVAAVAEGNQTSTLQESTKYIQELKDRPG